LTTVVVHMELTVGQQPLRHHVHTPVLQCRRMSAAGVMLALQALSAQILTLSHW
jgi:hypothetical protein